MCIYIYIYRFLATRNLSFWNSGGQKSFIQNFWRPEIFHSGILVARNPSFGNSGGQNALPLGTSRIYHVQYLLAQSDTVKVCAYLTASQWRPFSNCLRVL